MELNQTALFKAKGFQTFYWLSINLSDDRRTTSEFCMMKKHLYFVRQILTRNETKYF